MPYRQPARRRTKVLRFCLDVLTKPTPCPVPWDEMYGGACERTCPRCDASVFDVAAMSDEDAEVFLEEHLGKPPFLDLRRRNDGRVMEVDCAAGARRRVAFRAVAIALALGAAVVFVSR
jgi:hypothetical protein